MQSTRSQGGRPEKDYGEHLNYALSLCYNLRLDDAESALSEIIEKHPSACDAYSALALIRLMQGRPDTQREILRHALSINPSHYASLHQLAIVHYRASEFGEAYKQVKRALAQKSDSESSLLLASRVSLALSDSQESYQLAERVLRQSDGCNSQAANLMALALIAQNDPKRLCEELARSIVAGQGDEIKLYAAIHLITALQTESQYLDLCDERLSANPDNKFLRLLRAKLLATRGRHDECFPDLYYLLSLEQNNLIVLQSYAEALLIMKRYRESLEVYLRIAQINGTDPHILNQIGICYRGLGRFRSSEKAYWRSIRLNPLDACIIGNLGEATFRFGNHERALELYGIALNIRPVYKEVFYNKMLSFSVGNPDMIPVMRREAANFWSCYRNTHVNSETAATGLAGNGGQIAMPGNRRSRPSKLRIGILSSDIGNHCVSYFLTSFLRHYNKDRFHVELILCDRRYEEREQEICGYVDHAQSLDGLSEYDARNVIKRLNLDLIIECNGYTGGSGLSLLAERCAPIQCHYIGYHASTGLDTIDYFISDHHILSPSVTEQLSEKPLQLDRAWLAFSKFEEFPKAVSTATVNRPVLGFFGNSTKITDVTLQYWSALFQNCPHAILALKCLSYRDQYIVQNLLARIESVGIERHRIAMLEPTASWRDHLEYYNLIDYALDSTFWSSATTGFDALGMGVPLLAIQGDTIAARMSSSLVAHLGRHEWLATKPEDYARLGRQISSEFMEVRGQKRHLQAEVQHSSLFDGPDLARSLEKGLMQVTGNTSKV